MRPAAASDARDAAAGRISVRRAVLGWSLCVALGLALGFACRIPLWATYLAARVIAQEAGWAYFDATFDEGVGFTVGVTIVVWVVFASVAGPLSVLSRWWTWLPARPWWWTTALLWLLPFAVLDAPTLP